MPVSILERVEQLIAVRNGRGKDFRSLAPGYLLSLDHGVMRHEAGEGVHVDDPRDPLDTVVAGHFLSIRVRNVSCPSWLSAHASASSSLALKSPSMTRSR